MAGGGYLFDRIYRRTLGLLKKLFKRGKRNDKCKDTHKKNSKLVNNRIWDLRILQKLIKLLENILKKYIFIYLEKKYYH